MKLVRRGLGGCMHSAMLVFVQLAVASLTRAEAVPAARDAPRGHVLPATSLLELIDQLEQVLH